MHQSLGVVDCQRGLEPVIHADDADFVLLARDVRSPQGVDLIGREFHPPLDVKSELGRAPAQAGRCTRS